MSFEERLLKEIKEALINLDENKFLSLIDEALKRNIDVEKIVFQSMSEGMKEIGKLFEEGEYFLAEMIVAAEMFKKAMKILEPKLLEKIKEAKKLFKGRIVIGTVKGDIHDIGKSLVASMLRAAGYEVIDLGVDVPAEKFVEAVEKYKPDILGMSSLLTTTVHQMKEVIRLLKEKGLRSKVKVIIGGLATSPEYAKIIGADGWGKDAVHTIQLVNKLIGGLREGKLKLKSYTN
ncbi:MAG: cobalamin-binding protein [Desulfurococcales archaeon ex4484_217_2]|nr:MAG: cobalamin-binding protein [Desulfurococcales archaeon ex4484_217_2]